jgi:type I restriction enzyme S subunit
MGTALKNISSVRYSSYKDSGIEWVENVPAHWDVKKFKRVFYEIKKRSNPDLNCGSISFGKVVYKDDEKIPESTKKSYQVVKKGDFLVNPLNLNYDLISLRIALSDIDVVVSSGYIVLSNSVKLDKTFYKYFLHRFDVAFMKLLGSGVRQTLNWNDIANCDLIFPPIPEQTAIATFLDRKTALIDQAIDIKQKQIELLKERRQILIHKAVTRGLNPNVKMKDSGVEWIGEIPEHWEVKRLKDICFINLNSLPENTNSNFEFNYVDIGSVTLESGICNTEEFIFKNAPSRARRIAKTGDTIISTVRTYLKAIDFIDQVKSSNIYSTGFAVLQPKEFICPEFLGYFVRSDAFTEQVSVNSKGMSYPAINSTDIGRLTVVHCETIEQQMIVKHIESNNTKIAKAISLKEHEIEKLKEYKATLINSAVTGKIKVYNDAK